MIRKAMMCVMAAAMASGFGCSAESREAAEKVTIRPEKVLIVYYSWSGNTRVAAEQIRKITGGTLFEIKTAKAYPAEYDACVEQAKKECRSGFCPELASKAGDLAKYDVIFLGTPNWWSTMAPPRADIPDHGKPFRKNNHSVRDPRRRRNGKLRAGYAEDLSERPVCERRRLFRKRNPECRIGGEGVDQSDCNSSKVRWNYARNCRHWNDPGSFLHNPVSGGKRKYEHVE